MEIDIAIEKLEILKELIKDVEDILLGGFYELKEEEITPMLSELLEAYDVYKKLVEELLQ
ncbi:hypothetical protein EBU71_08940 [bacterium]|jgi:hypothetical protein|nr:hypothetical protein [Candidatus Elulimicrobium humile]